MPDRSGGGRRESMALIQAPARWIGQQVDERASRRHGADPVEQRGQDGVAQTAPLVLGEHRHVHHMEVPATVADHPAHPHRRAAGLTHDVHRCPASGERRSGLIAAFERQTGAAAELEVLVHGGRPVDQAVALRELGGRHPSSLSDGDGQPWAAVRHPGARVGAVADDNAVDDDQPPGGHAVDRRCAQPVSQPGRRPAGGGAKATEIADQDRRRQPVADPHELDPGALRGAGED